MASNQPRDLRQRLEQQLLDRWYSDGAESSPLALLRPATALYRAISQRRYHARQKRETGSRAANQPLVVVIGNITVGGTGKTPLLLAMARELHRLEISTAVISRGYGGSLTAKDSQAVHRVHCDDSPRVVGDEPALLARELANLEIPVVIAQQRQLAVNWLASEQGVEVILSDDGLQHYAMARDVEYVVIDGKRGLGNEKLLPEGPLRELPERLGDADLLVLNGESGSELQQKIASFGTAVSQVSMRIGSLRAVNAAASAVAGHLSIAQLATLPAIRSLQLAAGIGNPQKFFNQLQLVLAEQGINIPTRTTAWPDHHDYSVDDLASLWDMQLPANQQLLLVTEKDAVKLAPLVAEEALPVFAVGLAVDFGPELLEPIMGRLR